MGFSCYIHIISKGNAWLQALSASFFIFSTSEKSCKALKKIPQLSQLPQLLILMGIFKPLSLHTFMLFSPLDNFSQGEGNICIFVWCYVEKGTSFATDRNVKHLCASVLIFVLKQIANQKHTKLSLVILWKVTPPVLDPVFRNYGYAIGKGIM